jgi:hypothetical protein
MWSSPIRAQLREQRLFRLASGRADFAARGGAYALHRPLQHNTLLRRERLFKCTLQR